MDILDEIIILDFLYALKYYRRNEKKRLPRDILQKRFASGEITKEHYLEHKIILETI